MGQSGQGQSQDGLGGMAGGAVCPVHTGRPADTGHESSGLVPIDPHWEDTVTSSPQPGAQLPALCSF